MPSADLAARLLAQEIGRDDEWAAAQVTAYADAVRAERGVLGLEVPAVPDDTDGDDRATGRLGRLATWIDRHPRATWALVAVWSAAWFAGTYVVRNGDWLVFMTASRAMLGVGRVPEITGGPLHVYEQIPLVQVGPPALLLSFPAALVPGDLVRLLTAALMMAGGVACAWPLRRAQRALDHTAEQRAGLVLGALILGPAWTAVAARWMHLDDALALVLLAFAAPCLVRGRAVAAPLLLGVAGAAKPWAVGFWPLLLILPRPKVAPAALVCLGAAAVWWLPFVVAAPDTITALGRYQTPNHAAATPAYWIVGGAHVLRGWRLLQMAAMTAAAAVAVRRGWWKAAPLVAVTVRIALDPQTYSYYGSGAVFAALWWDALDGRRFPVATAITAAVELGLPLVAPNPAMAAVRALAACGLLAWAALGPRESTAAPPANYGVA